MSPAIAACTKVVSTSKEFRSVMQDRHPRCSIKVEGLIGRVLRGKSANDFSSLSDDPNRRVIFLLGSDGMSQLIGLNQAQILNQIGYPKDYVANLKKQGTRFKLAVFKPLNAQTLATWDYVLKLVEDEYPSVAEKIKLRTADLKTHSLAEIQAQNERKFSDIEKLGTSDPEYIDLTRLEARAGTEWEVRAFLFNVVHLNELFSGDGQTRLQDGKLGAQEFVSRNLKVTDLKDAVLIDLDHTVVFKTPFRHHLEK